MIMENKKTKNLAICSSIGIMLLLGLYYCWSVFSNTLVEVYGWNYSEASLPYSICNICYALAIFVFGFVYEKIGPKKTLLISVTMMCIGLLGSGLLFGKKTVALFYGLFYGGGSSGCYTSSMSTLLKWVPERRRALFSGLATGAYGLAGVYTSLIANALTIARGVPFTFVAFACAIIPLLLLADCFMLLPEKNSKENIEDTEEKALDDIPLKSAIKLRRFWFILIIYLFGCAAGNAIIGNISNIASLQSNIKNSVFFVSLMAFCNCAGRLIGGLLGDRFKKKTVLSTVLLLDVISLLLFRFYNSAPLLIIGTLITGFAFGCEMCLIPPFLTEYFGVEYYSEIYGAVIGVGCITGLIGPQLAGRLVDVFGSFNPVYILCACYIGVACLLAFLLPEGRAEV